MKLGYYHQATQQQVVGLDSFIPAYFFNPPAGSDWAHILSAWDGQPGSLITVTLNNGTVLQNWKASCSAQITVPGPGGNVRDGAAINAGDDVSTSYGSQYPYALVALNNQSNTQQIQPSNAGDGSVVGHTTAGLQQTGIDAFISAVALAATAVVAGGAIVGAAGAAGGGAGEGTAAGGIGATGGGVDSTIPVIDSASITDVPGTMPTIGLGDADLTGAASISGAVSPPSISDLTSLPSDLQPTSLVPSTPDVTPPSMPTFDLPESAMPSPADMIASMPSADLSALSASTGGIPSASSLLSSGSSLMPGSGTIGKAIGSIIGAIGAAGSHGLPGSVSSNGQEGRTGSNAGAGGLIILAAVGTLLYLSQQRGKR